MKHPWDVSCVEAKAIQERYRRLVQITPLTTVPRFVAGCDVAYSRRYLKLFAAVLVFDLEKRAVIEERTSVQPARFPYVPGLLSFREAPAILDAVEKLEHPFDVLIVDGHGYAHPRRFGLACHVGVLLDVPAIGCAKKRLIGEEGTLESKRGATAPLVQDGEMIGRLLRTRPRTKPVYVSVGHKVTLDEAVQIVMAACTKYRLPEPTRRAHQLVTARRENYDKLTLA